MRLDSKLNLFRTPGIVLLVFGAFLTPSNLSFAAESSNKSSAGSPGQPSTFAKDIAPIFQDKCQDCHRKGSMAPMSLVTYAETRPWAKAIKERVVLRQMPPWHIDKTVGIQSL